MNTTTAAPVNVNGSASIGDTVAYTDQANPRTTYVVVELPDRTGSYKLLETETYEPTWSDLRQHGWTFVSERNAR